MIEQVLWWILLSILMMFVILLVVVILPTALNIGIKEWIEFKNNRNKLKEEKRIKNLSELCSGRIKDLSELGRGDGIKDLSELGR